MAVTNFLVSTLPAYVEANRDLIIKNFALVGNGTRSRIGLRTGIKGKEYINFLDLTATIQDGSGCGFNPLDEINLTQRTLETAAMKADGQICPESLLGTYAQYLVRIAATENDFPFEAYVIDALVRDLNKKIEALLWTADSSGSDLFDGFLTQMAADADVIPESIASGSTAYAGLMQVYAAMPDEALERGGAIFVEPAIYRAFLSDMVNMNFYHYSGPQDAAPEEFILPGTDVRVIKTPGLATTKQVVATFADNLVYGTDAENDNERVDIWWSQDDRVFKYQVKWNSGVAYYFPAQIVLGTFAAAPAASAPVVSTLAAISECVCAGE